MIGDMRMRKLELKTRAAYLRAVMKRTVFLKRSPDTAAVEDLRRLQLYLVDQGSGHAGPGAGAAAFNGSNGVQGRTGGLGQEQALAKGWFRVIPFAPLQLRTSATSESMGTRPCPPALERMEDRIRLGVKFTPEVSR